MANFLDQVMLRGAFTAMNYGKSGVRRIFSAFWRLSRRKRLCIALAAALPVFLRLILLVRVPEPQPAYHDEFSYLLGADTFAHGRVANPPHPLWPFFETFHVNFVPTYTSKYPPAQAALLALGWKLTGHPWAGVLLSVAFLSGAACWMLQGWLPPPWALAGTILFALQTDVLGYWMNSYWGGALAAGAGALVIGSLPRILRRNRMRDGIPFAMGAAILANCRPFEGLVLVLASGCVLLAGSLRRRHFRWLVPVAAGGALTLLFAGWYNYRLTGDALLLPYLLHEQRYEAVPLFWFMPPAAHVPQYTSETFRRYWAVWDAEIYRNVREHFIAYTVARLFLIFQFFAGSLPLTVLSMTIPFLVASRKARLPMGLLAVFTAAVCLEKATFPHYFAPAAPILFLLLTMSLRRMTHAWSLPGATLAAILLFCFAGRFLIAAAGGARPEGLDATPAFAQRRSDVVQRLQGIPGQHLVLVRYGAQHDFHQEWVYNAADIDHSAIVWAHDFDPQRNRPLLAYYPGRRVWLLEPDGSEVKLTEASANSPTSARAGFTPPLP